MKNEEDEAFDELAKRQGAWGGGFKAKQAMAADKMQEPVSLRDALAGALGDVYGCSRTWSGKGAVFKDYQIKGQT